MSCLLCLSPKVHFRRNKEIAQSDASQAARPFDCKLNRYRPIEVKRGVGITPPPPSNTKPLLA